MRVIEWIIDAFSAVFFPHRTSLRYQVRKMRFWPMEDAPWPHAYNGVYKECFVGIEPDYERGGLKVGVSHPDQEKVLEKPRERIPFVHDVEVKENIIKFRIPCDRPQRPGIEIEPIIDTVIQTIA